MHIWERVPHAVVGSDRRILRTSSAWQALLGAVEGQPLATVLEIPEPAPVVQALLSEGGPVHTHVRSRAGQRVAVRLDRGPDPEGHVVVLQPRVDADEVRALRHAQARLARDLESRIRDAADAREESRAKSAFLASMSHELRTPLNAIIGYGELLLECAEDEEDRTDLGRICDAARHLLRIISGILDLSKIEAGRMDVYVEQVDVGDALRSVADTVASLVAKGGNELVVQAPEGLPPLITDAAKLRQILINLVGNAAKFTDAGTITLGAQGERGQVRLWVTDTGIGIPPDKLDSLFDRFVQAERNTSKHYGGTGLGLAICKQFAELLGGTLVAESTLGQGTTFSVTLPLLPGAPGAGQRTPTPQPASTGEELPTLSLGPGVLVVDAPHDQAVLRRRLEPHGLMVYGAMDAERAVALARAVRPRVVLVDPEAPGIDGWRLLTELRRHPDTRDLPVLVHSATVDRTQAFALGAARVLAKPANQADVVLTVRELAHARRGRVGVDVPDRVLRYLLQQDGWEVTALAGSLAAAVVGVDPSSWPPACPLVVVAHGGVDETLLAALEGRVGRVVLASLADPETIAREVRDLVLRLAGSDDC